MTRTSNLVAAITATIAIAACGGEDKNYDEPLGESANATALSSAERLSAAAGSNDINDISEAIGLVFEDMGLLMEEKMNTGSSSFGLHARGTAAELPATSTALDFMASELSEELGDCVTETPTRIEFDDCDGGFGIRIDGFVALDGDHYTMNLLTDLSGDEGTFTLRMTADLIINESELRGDLSVDMDISADGHSASAVFDAFFDLELTPECPLGTLEVNVRASAPGQPSQDIWVLAEFGPACGEVNVF